MKRRTHKIPFIVLWVLVLISSSQCKHFKNSLRESNNEVSSEETLKHAASDSKETSNEDDDVKDDCWVSLNAKWLFDNMAKLDAKYADVRKDYQKVAETNNFDKILLDDILKNQGESQRVVHKSIVDRKRIPRGLNLGGRCMIRLEDSVLFFHRMKLRNSTIFRVDYLHSDLMNMTLYSRLSLHDLRLFGSYERALVDRNPSNLFYRPTYGELEILLKNVRYKMEGRFRLLNDQLVIEMVISEILVSDITMSYKTNATCGDNTIQRLEKENVDKLLRGIKMDLDIWLKDYFNDYLRYYGLDGVKANELFQKYDWEKAGILNRFTEMTMETLRNRMRKLRALSWKVPGFTIYAVNGMQIRLKNGVLRGLDSMHRRSVATGKIEQNIRYVNAILGFGKLRLIYEYDAIVSAGSPPVTGVFMLSSDQLTAKMTLALVKDPETAELNIEFFKQLSEELLTIEGPINRMIANFKHILENHIMTLMYNNLVHHVSMLSRLTKCDPDLPGHVDEGEYSSEESDGEKSGNKIPSAQKQTADGQIEIIPDSELKQAYIGLARADSVEFELPSDDERHRKLMHMKYNERIAIDEVKPSKSEATTNRNKPTFLKVVESEEDTRKPGSKKSGEDSDTSVEKPVEVTTKTNIVLKDVVTSNSNKGDFDIRVSREDSVEIDMPDKDGKMVSKKIKYWEGAALGDNPEAAISKANIRRKFSY